MNLKKLFLVKQKKDTTQKPVNNFFSQYTHTFFCTFWYICFMKKQTSYFYFYMYIIFKRKKKTFFSWLLGFIMILRFLSHNYGSRKKKRNNMCKLTSETKIIDAINIFFHVKIIYAPSLLY